MGPTIILDKSAFQALGWEHTFELSRYFYVVVPPVLVMEILADLKHPRMTPDIAKSRVMHLARCIQPVDGKVNVDYRTLCVADLLGGKIRMRHVPVVAGARKVRAADGSFGVFLDMQPENEALLRWSCGYFDDAEEILAKNWREASRSIDLKSFKSGFRCKTDIYPITSIDFARKVVDMTLTEPTAQLSCIEQLVTDLQTIPEVREWTLRRFRTGDFKSLASFAPYATHCLRTSLIFRLALLHGLVGTRATNRIDMEYLYYLPFTHIFCSGDKFHRALATELLDDCQTFVWSDDLRASLDEMAGVRISASAAGDANSYLLQPPEGSLIRALWIKHLGHWQDPYGRQKEATKEETKEETKATMERLKPWIEACNRASREAGPHPKWPCP